MSVNPHNPMAERLLLKPDEAAAALAVSPRCLWGLTKAGEIPAVRIGRAVRYDVADLLTWIEARKAPHQRAGE